MKCENTKRRLSEYLDGVLPDEEHAAVEAHVAECAGCRTELEALRRTVEAVAGLPHHRAPAGFRARVAARVRAEAVARPGRGARIISLWPRLAAVAAMFILAAGITFLVDGGLWLPGSPDGDRLAMKEGREAPALTPGRGVAGTALTHNGTLDAPAAMPPDEAEDGGLADDKRRSGLRSRVAEGLDAPREANGFALGDVVTLKAGANGRRYEHDRAMDEARKAGDLRPGQPLRQAGLARTADFDVDQPHQVLMLQDSRPILLATQAMDLAARNDGRFDLALVPQGDRGDEIVLVLYIPVEQYEAFLSQVTDLVPMRQQRLSNTMVTKQQPYFQDVLVNYYEQQTGEPITKRDWEAMAISGSGGGPSGPARSPAAQPGADHETARLFRDRHVPVKLATDADGDAPVANATAKSEARRTLSELAAARPG
ncbi:MAG: zf-HC2 domain-containing protein, partial [Candidatus Brocadiia bacterium]|nr:zf-HC2 domain-containing protein [Candidatus Brocadiia bacterium]